MPDEPNTSRSSGCELIIHVIYMLQLYTQAVCSAMDTIIVIVYNKELLHFKKAYTKKCAFNH
jgi:hypothetical protein